MTTSKELLDVPQKTAGGLTIRELNASLEDLHLKIDPADTPADKARKIAAAERDQ